MRSRLPREEEAPVARDHAGEGPNDGIQLLPDRALEATKVALEDWHRDEIKTTPAQHREFGRFLFTVSLGSIGVLATIANMRRAAVEGGWVFVLALATLAWLTSAWAAIHLAKPTVVTIELGERLNLSKAHKADGAKFRDAWFTWFMSYCVGWLFAFVFLIVAVLG